MGVLLMMRKEKSSRYMGASTLVLGFGDAFHLNDLLYPYRMELLPNIIREKIVCLVETGLKK